MKKLATKLAPSAITQRHNKQVMAKVADQLGFVYFGNVSRSGGNHPLVRGLTLSSHHQDRHYTVGSLKGYDISIIQRTDTLGHPGRGKSQHNWLIVQVDLHTPVDVPHAFIGLHSHSEIFYAQLFSKFGRLQKLPYTTEAGYPGEFLARYAVYGQFAKLNRIQHLIDTEVCATMAAHFGTLTVELERDNIYVYSEHSRITTDLIHTMIQNGVWLASVIDQRAQD